MWKENNIPYLELTIYIYFKAEAQTSERNVALSRDLTVKDNQVFFPSFSVFLNV